MEIWTMISLLLTNLKQNLGKLIQTNQLIKIQLQSHVRYTSHTLIKIKSHTKIGINEAMFLDICITLQLQYELLNSNNFTWNNM